MTDIVLDDAVWADVEEGTEALLQEWQVAAGDAWKPARCRAWPSW